jgi:anaerobic magnesium-protoporphyrin IX monomethyl ester cyclase
MSCTRRHPRHDKYAMENSDSHTIKSGSASAKDCRKEAKRVLLLFPPFGLELYGAKWIRSETPFAPLGLSYLATPLIRSGYDVRIIDLQVDHLSEAGYFKSLQESDFVLISCFTFAADGIRKIIGDIRHASGKAVIICGGPLCNETKKHIEDADYTVFGEADLMIARILELIENGEPLSDIPGLCYRHEGKLLRNPGVLQVEDLDLVEIPSLNLTADKDYGYMYGIKIDKIVPVITTRGCRFKCTFCTYQSVNYRERSVDNVMQEIELRVASGAEYIVLCDDNFLLHPRRANEIFDRIIQRRLKVKIIVQGRIDIIDRDLALKMRRANVIILIFGIESVNQDVLNFYNKKTTTDRIKQVIEIVNSAGIITISGLIIGAPVEEMEHFERTIEFFRKVPQDFINVNILRYQHPSPLWINAMKNGLIGSDEMVVYANEKLSNFSYDRLLGIQKMIIRSFYNNPGRILRIVYKVSRHFGIFMIFRILMIYIGKGIYRPPQEFHQRRS